MNGGHDHFWGVDEQAMADYAALYPWTYPLDAGFVSAWPSTVENPDPTLDWPYMYDPYSVGSPQVGQIVIPGSPPPYPEHYAGELRAVVPESLWGPLQQAGQSVTRSIGEGLSTLQQGIAHSPLGAPTRIERKVSDVGDKASDAADTVKIQANVVGDDARRTMAMMQASMVAANQHLEDASKKAQSTADAIKYVVFGIGALATVALVFHIVKQSAE